MFLTFSQPLFVSLHEDALHCLVSLFDVIDVFSVAWQKLSDFITSVQSAVVKSDHIGISVSFEHFFVFSEDFIMLFLLAEVDLFHVSEGI